MSTWKRKRFGIDYVMGVQRRQIRVGRPQEPIAVLRLIEDAKAGDEIVMTTRDLRFCSLGVEYERAKNSQQKGT